MNQETGNEMQTEKRQKSGQTTQKLFKYRD